MFKSSDVAYLNPSGFNIIYRIFGMGYGLRFNWLFKFQESLNNLTRFVFSFGCAKEGASHLDLFASSVTPNLTGIYMSFWTSLCVPSVLDKVASTLAPYCPLIPSIPEWYSAYLTYCWTDLRISLKELEVYNIPWRLYVDIFWPRQCSCRTFCT